MNDDVPRAGGRARDEGPRRLLTRRRLEAIAGRGLAALLLGGGGDREDERMLAERPLRVTRPRRRARREPAER